MKKYVLLFIFGSLLMGCSSKGFNRGSMREQLSVTDTPPQVSDRDIQSALDKKAQLPKNLKLAVYFKPPENNYEKKWRWTEQDKTEFFNAFKNLKEDGIDAKVFPLISSITTDTDLKSLRLAAARHGADALLIVNGAAEVDRYFNDYGASYSLILPALFVKGSTVDGLFMVNATLWDVRNEFLYLSTESEGTYSKNYIAAFPEQDKEVMEKSKLVAMQGLKENLSAMISGQ